VYVSVNATQFASSVEPSNAGKFSQLARNIKDMLLKDERKLDGQGDIYGVIFWQDEGEAWTHNGEIIIKEKNVVVFADGQIDRSPRGSGMSARVAIHHANGRMRASHGTLLSKSVIGTSFEGRIAASEDPSTCISIIRGRAGLVGRMKFFIDPQDPIYPGFLLR
jgi:proline racemase